MMWKPKEILVQEPSKPQEKQHTTIPVQHISENEEFTPVATRGKHPATTRVLQPTNVVLAASPLRLTIGQDRINMTGFIGTGPHYWICLSESGLIRTGFTVNSQRFRPVP
ncbi:hypothetical protein KY290_007575 [Solanum tuberosum]|uniref:Uncharacterized protein n=1 Tax=Solanum tuberosum TaxID=4113 RepID=A0ABQ7W5Z5_SOLTU|nr:hypothetical protein KY290_007575 [Solanum tuberosum]